MANVAPDRALPACAACGSTGKARAPPRLAVDLTPAPTPTRTSVADRPTRASAAIAASVHDFARAVTTFAVAQASNGGPQALQLTGTQIAAVHAAAMGLYGLVDDGTGAGTAMAAAAAVQMPYLLPACTRLLRVRGKQNITDQSFFFFCTP